MSAETHDEFDIWLGQESHADDYETVSFDKDWAHSHLIYWSHGLQRSQSCIVDAICRKCASQFDYVFSVDIHPGRCSAVISMKSDVNMIFCNYHISPQWTASKNIKLLP